MLRKNVYNRKRCHVFNVEVLRSFLVEKGIMIAVLEKKQ